MWEQNISEWNTTLQNHHSTASTTPDAAQGYATGPVAKSRVCHEFACPTMPRAPRCLIYDLPTVFYFGRSQRRERLTCWTELPTQTTTQYCGQRYPKMTTVAISWGVMLEIHCQHRLNVSPLLSVFFNRGGRVPRISSSTRLLVWLMETKQPWWLPAGWWYRM